MDHRRFKDSLYTQFARLGHAVSTPKRLELLDLMNQGEKTVEQLAGQSATAIKNTSAHLRVLRQARLVETRRDGQRVWYRLADEGVAGFLSALQRLGRQRYAEVREVAEAYLERRDQRKEIVAYCRGPYCVYAVEAVELLRKRGYRVRRFIEGMPAWRAHGYPVARGHRRA
jgi:DNA-binding transcriptional ArsR family regulator